MAWTRGQAYSQDLRDRVLAAVDSGVAVRQAAPTFQASISYIYKALIRHRLSNGAIWTAANRLGLSFKKKPARQRARSARRGGPAPSLAGSAALRRP